MPAPTITSLKEMTSVLTPPNSIPPAKEGVMPAINGGMLTMVVGSVAVSLLVFNSPPPETVAILVTLAGAVADTLTVSVNAG